MHSHNALFLASESLQPSDEEEAKKVDTNFALQSVQMKKIRNKNAVGLSAAKGCIQFGQRLAEAIQFGWSGRHKPFQAETFSLHSVAHAIGALCQPDLPLASVAEFQCL